MLILTDVIAPREERIRLDGNTADVEWGQWQWGGGNIYWFISNSPTSLVEIGAQHYDGSLASISIKLIDSIYTVEQVTLDEANAEVIVGLPCFNVEPSEKPLTYIDVNQPVCAIIDTNRIIVGIGENLKCSKRVQTEHVIFGFNDLGALVTLELYNLSEAELALVRQAIDALNKADNLINDNHKYLETHSGDLDRIEEVMLNINTQLHFPPPAKSITIAYQVVTMTVFSIILIYVAVLPLLYSVLKLIALAQGVKFEYRLATLCGDLWSLLMLLVGILALRQAMQLITYTKASKSTYDQLVSKGSVFQGTVTKVTQEPHKTEVYYKFTLQNGRNLEGKYVALRKLKLESGDKTTILHLNDKLNILL